MNESALTFLNALEQREARLLSWGVADVQHTADDLEALADELEFSPVEAEDAQEELKHAHVLLRFEVFGQEVFRTRMAETVRLMERLRQVFREEQWDSAPRLVSGFRFNLGERRSPERDLPASSVLASLKDLCPDGSVAGDVARTMIGEWTLSEFQKDAMRAVIDAGRSRNDRGVMITAGTGAGKTLAFYLPGLALLAERLPEPSGGAARVLAVYPRQELLKDQMATAVAQVLGLDPVWSRAGRRPRLGALYGDTPKQMRYLPKSWEFRGDYRVCPYIRSPAGNPMGVRITDAQKGTERLFELFEDGRTGLELGPEHVVLSRERMAREAPDLLLCSTEMINRGLTDVQLRQVLTGDGRNGPRLMLLDEVHLYEGISGAQTAMTLRRWRHAVGADIPVTFVGLSATLLQAGRFFSDLTGLPAGAVEEVAPRPDKLKVIGSKYSLVLRGDPYSRAQLLSTSLQAVMLLSRMLDPTPEASSGLHPRKSFVFTDDLDVTQRMLSDLRDAEQGGPCRLPMPLAGLRSTASVGADKAKMLLDGQYWLACERIGHDLRRAKRISEVSSRSRGIDPLADVVVATASLEVGFDDDEVGAVLQHKAPRSPASFVQRIGRAGRQAEARPWSVVVLSDYGRDRMAYQAYEQLFEPALAPPRIPIGNRYLLGMQAAYATMDWLCERLAARGMRWGSVWRLLAYPSDLSPGENPPSGKQRGYAEERQGVILELIEDVLRARGGERRSLLTYLAMALKQSDKAIQRLCWEQPRPIVSEMLPTIRRRLRAQWRRHVSPPGTTDLDEFGWNPLTEFVPGNLFSSLNLPEVEFVFPDGRDPKSMPIEQAMRAFAPGRVNKRFTQGTQASLWCMDPDPALLEALVDDGASADVNLGALVDRYEQLGNYEVPQQDGSLARYQVLRPRSFLLRVPPNRRGDHPSGIVVSDTMHSRLQWHSQIDAAEPARRLELPPVRPAWTPLQHVQFQTHGEHCPVDVRRFAPACDVSVRLRQGKERITSDTEFRFVWGPEKRPAAMGYTVRSDGARFAFQYPTDLLAAARSERVLPSLRVSYMTHCWMRDPELPAELGYFARGHVLTVALVALTAWTAAEGVTPAGAADRMLASQRVFESAGARALTAILGDTGGRESAEDDIRASLGLPGVRERLRATFPMLWAELGHDDDGQFEAWLCARYRSTLGHAVLATARTLCPDFDERDVVLDLEGGPPMFAGGCEEQGDEAFWLVESTPGGAGAIEALAEAFASDPARFSRLVGSALGPGDWEVVDAEMRRILKLSRSDGAVLNAIEEFRGAVGFEEKAAATEEVRRLLSACGVRLTDAVRNTVFSRWLRPGSTPDVDALLEQLIRYGDEWESRHGFELDPRTLAFLAGTLEEFRPAFAGLPGPDDPEWRSGQALSLLWPRGLRVRSESLKSYSPFTDQADPDRLLLVETAPRADPVLLEGEDWRLRLTDQLRAHGRATLQEGAGGREALAKEATLLLCEPIMLGSLRVFPRLVGVSSAIDAILIEFDLAEITS